MKALIKPGLGLSVLLLALPCLVQADDLQQDKLVSGARQDDQMVMYIGTVAVGGKRNVLEALQDIKVALEQPISNDPKLADVMVCRLTDDIGTHAKQILICATNRTLNTNRELLQSTMDTSLSDTDAPPGGDGHGGASTACASMSCYQDTVSILDQSVNTQRHHYIKQQVNGGALHALLAGIPYPKPQATPAATSTPAPAAATAHV